MLNVDQGEEAPELKPLTNNNRQEDQVSLTEEIGIIYNKLEQELIGTGGAQGQLLHTYVCYIEMI